MQSFELPRAIHIESKPFSVANDLLTPTFELRRAALLKKYKRQVGMQLDLYTPLFALDLVILVHPTQTHVYTPTDRGHVRQHEEQRGQGQGRPLSHSG